MNLYILGTVSFRQPWTKTQLCQNIKEPMRCDTQLTGQR